MTGRCGCMPTNHSPLWKYVDHFIDRRTRVLKFLVLPLTFATNHGPQTPRRKIANRTQRNYHLLRWSRWSGWFCAIWLWFVSLLEIFDNCLISVRELTTVGDTKALASISGPMEVRLAAEQANKATFEVLVRPLSGLPGASSSPISFPPPSDTY